METKHRNLILSKFYEKEYNTYVKRITFRAGSPENAEDIVQEAFARALKYWSSFDPEKKELAAWFSSILNNSLKAFKKDELRYGMCEELDEEQIDGVTFDSSLSTRTIKEQIWQKPSNIAEVLDLYYIKGYKPREIEEVLEAESAFISRVVYNFREELKEKLHE